jgi:hypothetical protein
VDLPQSEFLPAVIGILDRLHQSTAEQGQATLSLLIDLAKTEAEDALRQAGIDAEMRATLRATSTIGAWK